MWISPLASYASARQETRLASEVSVLLVTRQALLPKAVYDRNITTVCAALLSLIAITPGILSQLQLFKVLHVGMIGFAYCIADTSIHMHE